VHHSRREAKSPCAVGTGQVRTRRSVRQWLQQKCMRPANVVIAATTKQANMRMHNVKRFVTSASWISLRCHGDVIIDVSTFSGLADHALARKFTNRAKCSSKKTRSRSFIVHNVKHFTTRTFRISFRCHADAIIDVSSFSYLEAQQ